MFEELNAHRLAVQENIEKSFQIGFTESEGFEKAHKVGDIHPNGKWVWTQLPSGKFDWRVIKLDKPGGNRVLNQISDKQRQTYEEIENLINHGKRLTTAQANFYNNLKPSMDKLKKQASASQSQKTEEGKDVEKELKKKTKSTDDTQSDDKVKLTEGDFKKGVVEKDEYTYTRKNAIDLHDYTGKSIEYYTDNGEKKKAQPYISEFYDSAKQDAVGGYEAFFDRADSIGTFRTLKEAISALETWINNMRVKGHAKPKWIYNESGGRYQMNYRLN